MGWKKLKKCDGAAQFEQTPAPAPVLYEVLERGIGQVLGTWDM